MEHTLQGSPASQGQAEGEAYLVKTARNGSKFPRGAVLVAEMTHPDLLPAMRKSIAIVTENGGRTCHAAIVAREFKIPCVVGVGKELWHWVRYGTRLQVDGTAGTVTIK